MFVRLIGLSLAGVAAALPAARAGLKIVTRETGPGPNTVETTRYVQLDRSRVEARVGGHQTIVLTRCDLQRTLVLDVAYRTYSSAPLNPYPNALVRLAASFASRRRPRQPSPTLLVETTTVDTGERKTAFGHTARRVIITRRDIPLPERNAAAAETRTDGWYIDLETRPSCERNEGRTVLVGVVTSGSDPHRRAQRPVVTFKDIGAPERGFPIDVTTTWQSGSDDRRVVTELSHVDLDPALFEIPHGFKPSEGRIAAFAASCARTWYMLKAALFH